MSGYKPGYSESHSPGYQAGKVDGTIDANLIAQCPPCPPAGPTPPDPEHPAMYLRGYQDVMRGAVPHLCTDKCRKDG